MGAMIGQGCWGGYLSRTDWCPVSKSDTDWEEEEEEGGEERERMWNKDRWRLLPYEIAMEAHALDQ